MTHSYHFTLRLLALLLVASPWAFIGQTAQAAQAHPRIACHDAQCVGLKQTLSQALRGSTQAPSFR